MVSLVNGSGWEVRDGRLSVEGICCRELAERFGTPLYVISEARLRENARRLQAALAEAWPLGDARLLPSLKANPTLATRMILNEEGLGCDTFGETELVAALRAGVAPDLISVNGASKSERLIRLAVSAGARVTIDSARELPLLEAAAASAGVRAPVLLRLRPRLSGIDAPSELALDGASIREVFQAYKAGTPIDDAVALGHAALRSRHVELVGVHVHFARQTGSLALWALQIESFVDLLAELSTAWDGWLPREIDIGGGWPTTPDPVGRRAEEGRQRPAPLDSARYASEVARALARALEGAGLARSGTRLEAEPGRAIYADAGLHLATVTNVKQQLDPEAHRWLETDTSEVFLLDTALEGSLFPVVAVDQPRAPATGRVDVTGISCNFDLIAPNVELPTLAIGDVVAFLGTGAYQDASAANFNGLPRPATVLVSGSTADVIKRRETVDEVLARDTVPPRLQARDGGPRVHSIDHVGLTIGDLSRSLAFWSDALGLPVLQREVVTDPLIASLLGVDQVELEIADLDAGDHRVIELIEYRTPRGTARKPSTHDPGTPHIALRVDDIATIIGRLGGTGARMISTQPVTLHDPSGLWDGVVCCYLTDPDGIIVELVERPR
jgi:diaminopimelate decarboxylase